MNGQVHDFDPVFPTDQPKDEGSPLTAILYGSIGSEKFYSLHKQLAEAARAQPSKGEL